METTRKRIPTDYLDGSQHLTCILRQAVDLVGADVGYVAIREEATGALVPKAWVGVGDWIGQLRLGTEPSIGGTDGLARPGFLGNERVLFGVAPPEHQDHPASVEVTSVLNEILVLEKEPMGLLVLGRTDGRPPFEAAERERVRPMIQQITLAVATACFHAEVLEELAEQRRAEEKLRLHARQLEAIRTVSEEITRELELHPLLHLITRRAVDLVAAHSGGVHLWDDGAQALIPRAWAGTIAPWQEQVRYRLGEGVVGTVAERRVGLIVNDYRQWSGALPAFLQRTDIAAVLAEPLLCKGHLLGVIAITRPSGQPFTAEDQGQLRLFAAQAAIGIENARLFREEQQRREQLEAVRLLSAEIARELDLDRLLDLILRRAAEFVGTEAGVIALWDEATQTLLPRVRVGTSFDPLPKLPIRLGEGITGLVAATRQGLIVNDYRQWSHARPETLRYTTFTAGLGEPLLYRGQLIGVINLAHEPGGGIFTPQHAALLRLFADQAAVAIQNARLFAEAQRDRRESEILASLARTINASLELDAVLQAVAEGARELCACDFAEIALRQPGEKVLHLRCVAGRRLVDHLPLTVELGKGIGGRILETGCPFRTENYALDPRINKDHLARVQALGAVAEMGVPIPIDGRIEGIIYVDNCDARAFSDRDEATLTRLAEYAAVAIRNARLYTELRDSFESLQRLQDELIRAEKLRGLGQMAAGIAHDLNNMLAAVLGQTELLRLRTGDAATLQSLQLQRTAALDGAAVVRRLQDFARQRATMPLTPCELAPLVEEALQITRPRWRDEAQRRNAAIQAEVALPPLPPVLGYASEIREALVNLIFNAVDAMPQGGALTFRARYMTPDAPALFGERVVERQGSLPLEMDSCRRPAAHLAPHAWVELLVTDTGSGIPPEVQGRIFEPFFTTKGVRGTGLGLSVVYGIMERHGGRIDVESKPGCGTTFRMRFQIAATSPPSVETDVHVGPSRRLLLVEDDRMVRETVAALLLQAGHQVTEAEEGADALAQMTRHSFDLVITDLGMPVISGWEVARQAKRLSPAPPVILMTGWGEHVSSEDGHEVWADRVLGKPVELAKLLAAIAELTARSA